MAQSAYEFDAESAIEDFDNADFFHGLSNKHYEMKIEDGRFVMTRYRKGSQGQRIHEFSKAADFVIGSGKHSKSYCYRDDAGVMYQMPVVWYSQTEKWGMAPGYDKADHKDFSRQIEQECMFCHNAYPEHEHGYDRFLSPHIFPKKLPHGIGCQRCHGPGEAHINAAENDPDSPEVLSTIVNSSKLPPQQRDDVCNQCHLQPTSSTSSFLRHFDRAAYSFRPGQELADFRSYVEPVNAEETDLFEINHHAYRLNQSKCFTESDGALNCVSCHNPHRVVPEEERVNFYRNKCFECHGGDECLDVERGRKSDSNCVECHMPKRRTQDVIHVTMTDHRIIRSPEGRDLLAPLKEVHGHGKRPVKRYQWHDGDSKSNRQFELNEVVLRLFAKDFDAIGVLQRKISNGETKADESKAVLAHALLELGRNDEALKLLDSISPKGSQYSSVQSSLGLGLIQAKKFDLAAKVLERAVTLKPVVPEAHFNLGIAYINTNRTEDAIEQFKKATKLQPNFTKGGFYLSLALSRNKQYKLAEIEIKRVLQVDPDYPNAALVLAGTQRYLNKRAEAIAMIEEERIFKPNDAAIAEEFAYLAIELVLEKQAQPGKSLDAAKGLFGLTQSKRNSRLILAVAMVQNGDDSKALGTLGSLDLMQQTPENLLVAAVAKANLKENEAAAKLYRRGKKALRRTPQPRSRMLKIAVRLAELTFDTNANHPD
jgi:tetratricopeptide (TPR) repeat protein